MTITSVIVAVSRCMKSDRFGPSPEVNRDYYGRHEILRSRTLEDRGKRDMGRLRYAALPDYFRELRRRR